MTRHAAASAQTCMHGIPHEQTHVHSQDRVVSERRHRVIPKKIFYLFLSPFWSADPDVIINL